MPATFTDWQQYPGEEYVVTGYFDARDTLISIAHIAEELFGIEASDPVRLVRDTHDTAKEILDHPDIPVFAAQELLSDTLNFLEDPQLALEDRANQVAQKLKGKFEPDLVKLRRPEVTREVMDQVFKEFPLFLSTDQRIRKDIVNYVLLLNRLVVVGKYPISAYKGIKSLMEFVEAPNEWLLSQLSEKIKKFVKGSIVFYSKERFYDAIGQDRIGCHSLLAKDHGKEWLYGHMKDCAMAVHWYIIKTMTRWNNKDFRTQATIKPDQKWINWLELIEFFLRHPAADQAVKSIKVTAPVNVIHVVKAGDTLSNLAVRYWPTAMKPMDALPTAMKPDQFTWETIANVNFNTYGLSSRERRDMVNQLLRDNHWGHPVPQKPKFAFNPGLRLIIPDQKQEVELAVPPSSGRKWYMEVMDKDWTVFPGFVDPETKKPVAGLKPHTPVYFKDTDGLKAQIKRGECLRLNAEHTYRL